MRISNDSRVRQQLAVNGQLKPFNDRHSFVARPLPVVSRLNAVLARRADCHRSNVQLKGV